MFVLCSNWMLFGQHKCNTKQKKTAKPPTKGIISHSFIKILGSHFQHIKNMHPRVTCRGKKKKHPLHPGRLVNPSDVEGVDAQICARWIRGRRQGKLVVHRPDGAQDPRCFVTIQGCMSSDGYDGYDGL